MVIGKKRFAIALSFSGVALLLIAAFIASAVFALLSHEVAGQGESIFSPYVLNILRFTLYQAVLSTTLSVGLAIPVAMALARQPKFVGRIWIIRLFAVPMGLPVIVGTLGIISIWGQNGTLNQLWQWMGASGPVNIYGLSGILLAHVFFNLPLASRLILASLERVPAEYWRSAAALGMTPASIFRFIEWPAMRKSLLSAATLIFMLCLTSFTIVLLLGGGPAATTIEVAIYQALRFDFDPQRAVALAMMQICLTVILLAATSIVPTAEDDRRTLSQNPKRFDGYALHRRLIDGVILALAVVLVCSPMIAVVVSGVKANLMHLLTSKQFAQAFITSFSIAIFAAFLTITASLCLCHARWVIGARRNPNSTAKAYSGLLGLTSSLVLLVPPVVIGSGWFLLLNSYGEVDGYVPILVGVINMLVSLPFVIRVVEPALFNYRERTERLVQSLGIEGLSKFRLVTWPLMRKPIAMAASFSMALSLGDLGAVALFGSEGFMTLPWLVYSNMGAYRSADAAGYALILGVICLALAVYGAGYDKEHLSGEEQGR